MLAFTLVSKSVAEGVGQVSKHKKRDRFNFPPNIIYHTRKCAKSTAAPCNKAHSNYFHLVPDMLLTITFIASPDSQVKGWVVYSQLSGVAPSSQTMAVIGRLGSMVRGFQQRTLGLGFPSSGPDLMS